MTREWRSRLSYGYAVEQGVEADKARAGKGTAALAAYARCSADERRCG